MSVDIKADQRDSIKSLIIHRSILKVTFLLATPPGLRLPQTEENKTDLSPFDPPPPKGSDPVWAFELTLVRG